MEKPKRPKKPTAPRISQPQQEVSETFYPCEHYYDLSSTRTRIEFLPWDQFPDRDDDSQEAQDFYDAHNLKASLTLQQLVDFAQNKNIPLDKIRVGAVIPHRDADYTEMELSITRQRSPEELASEQETYNRAMATYHAKLADYEQAKVDYPRLKAEWDLYEAQQKLSRLRAE